MVESDELVTQPEIFGRFILLEQLDSGDEGGAETSRAVDPARELQPLITVRRLTRWGGASASERRTFAHAAALRARAHATLLAPHVAQGEIGGVPYWATEYIPGISVDRVLERAIDRGGLSLHTTFTIATCIAAVLADLEADGTGRLHEAPRVAPLVHPRRIVIAWSGRPFFLGTSYEQERPDDEERRYADAPRSAPGADAFALAALVYELCTGLPFEHRTATLTGEGPLGRVPPAAHALLRSALARDLLSARPLLTLFEEQMNAAGGGLFADVAAEVGGMFIEERAHEEAQLERDNALARRFRMRLKARHSTESETTKLRLRPASQEGLAVGDPLSKKKKPDDDMVLVRGGRFLFGTPDELPSYTDVAPFLAARTPVTCADWLRFVLATGAAMPASWGGVFPEERARHPVMGLSHAQAQAYAWWAEKRLPTEVEWEMMARGLDGRLWPWGDTFDPGRVPETWRTPWLERATMEVGQHPTGNSPFGVGDIGVAWEWTSTSHADGGHVVRGGPWRNRKEPALVTNRSREEDGAPDVALRLVKSVADLDDETET